jgi:hypothetical protein
LKTQDGGTEKKASPRELMLKKLEESGLTEKDAKKLNLQPCTEQESIKLGLSRSGAGFKIPYYAASGKLLKMFRYRYFETVEKSGLTKGAKLRKYDQPANTSVEIYLPQFTDWQALQKDPAQALVVTEGELKAACGTKCGFPTVGLGGVFSFGSKDKGQAILPALSEFVWEGRDVFICYDSDAASNKQVVLAELRLAKQLTDLSAIVRVVRLPAIGKGKCGMDDYIVAKGADAFDALLNSSELFAACEALHQLNSEVLYVEHPSMVARYPRENHPTDQDRIRMMKVGVFEGEVFADRKYLSIGATGKSVERPAAKDWIVWPGRSKVDSVVYAPGDGQVVNGNQLNLWEGWGAKPVKGDVSLYTQLLDTVFKGADKAQRKWFEQWVAYPIQNPGAKLNSAVVVWSAVEGSGKSLLGYTIGRVYGKNYAEVTKAALSSPNNDWCAHKQFVVGEEITGGESRDVADLLKNMITGEAIRVNEKYVPNYFIKNCVNYYFTSNHQDAFFLSREARRYFIWEIVGEKASDAFFARYDKWYKTQTAIDALLYYLLGVDLTGFNPMAEAPRTQARKEMIDAGKSEHAAWISELQEFPDNKLRLGDVVLPYSLFTVEDLLLLYQPDDGSVRRRYAVTAKAFAGAMKEAGFKQCCCGAAVETIKGKKQRVWIVRPDARLDKLDCKAASEWYNKERSVKGSAAKARFVKG